MVVLKVAVCILALFAGTFFTTFILTGIEAKSPKFRKFTMVVNSFFPRVFWTAFVIVGAAFLTAFFYTHVDDYARAGIYAGLITGLFMYFRSVPTANEKDMEKATREAAKNRPKNILEFFAGPEAVKRDGNSAGGRGKSSDSGYHAHNGSKKNK